jgi:capsular exopolysaccharide synthesis family protein
MIDAQLVITNTQLAAADERERQLRGRLEVQQKHAVEMTPDAMRVSELEADIAQMQKQSDALDARVAEVSANSIEGGSLNIDVVDWARPPQKPAFPRTALTLIAALIASWLVGAGVVLLREWQDTRLRATTEIVSLLRMHVLAEVPAINRRLPASVRGQVVRVDPRSRAAEAYRAIRAAIDFAAAALPSPAASTAGAESQTPTILVCSPTPGDGKSTTASNLAIALANAGHRTLLVDCDLARPVQHRIFHADPAVGLSTVAAGEGKLADAVQPTVVPGLYLLPAGPLPPNPSDLLTGKRFALLMEALRGAFDRIVIDTPPLATSSDGMVLASSADATLLVVRLNQSLRHTATSAVDALQRSGANVLGVVANDVPPARAARRYAYPGLATADYADEPVVVRRQRRLTSRQHNGNGHGNGAAGAAAVPAIVEPEWGASAGA